jgi:hypothetical protein
MGIAAAQTAPGVSDEPQSISEVFGNEKASALAQASTTPLSHSYVIAHFPFGGGWNTRMMLANTGTSDATVDISFFQPGGAPALVPLQGQTGLQGSQHIKIAKNTVEIVGGDPAQRNTGSTEVAWATAKSNAPLNVFSLFDFGTSTTSISGAVGAQSTDPAKTFRFPVSVNGPLKYNAGLAMANPNGSATNVTVKLLDANGKVKSSIVKNLPANGQTIFLLNDKSAFFDDLDPSALFNGSVAVCADHTVGLVAIGVEGGAFFTTSVTNDPCP